MDACTLDGAKPTKKGNVNWLGGQGARTVDAQVRWGWNHQLRDCLVSFAHGWPRAGG